MEIVKQDIDTADSAKAFVAYRRHRIDLNVFVGYINLFLASIGYEYLVHHPVGELTGTSHSQGTLPGDSVN